MEGLEQTAKLLELIRERGFKPGDKLPSERDLAALFGMSRGAVREGADPARHAAHHREPAQVGHLPAALRRRAQHRGDGAVRRDQHAAVGGRGGAVGRAAQRARKRGACAWPACAAPRTTWSACSRSCDDSAAAIERGETLADLDAEFHKAIVAATKNDVLLRFINVFYLMSRKRREIYFHDRTQSKRSHAQHLQLYRAIEAQDAELGPADSAPPPEGRGRLLPDVLLRRAGAPRRRKACRWPPRSARTAQPARPQHLTLTRAAHPAHPVDSSAGAGAAGRAGRGHRRARHRARHAARERRRLRGGDRARAVARRHLRRRAAA